MDAVDQLISTLRGATFGERPSIKAQILALAKAEKGVSVREHLDTIKRGELLEIQWEIEDILAESAPPAPPPVEEPEAIDDAEETEPTTDSESEPIDPNAPLTAADLDMVYDDPRGLMLHKSKVGDRWFATQVDPQTGQPQTFELHAQELEQIKEQLHGSPYWRLGN
jgi:hypothetical protein